MTDPTAAKVTAPPRPTEAALTQAIAEGRMPGAGAGFADFLPDAEAIAQRRHSPYATWLIYTLALLVAAAVGWMHIAQIEDVVTVPGVVRAAGGDGVAISHPDGGRIGQVLVRNGDPVRQGQPLVLLDPTLPDGGDPVLRAPIDGTVAGLKDVATGTLIRPGEDIGTVLPAGGPRLEIEARIASDDIGDVAIGQNAIVKLHPIRRDTVKGRVVGIAPDTSPAARTPYHPDPAFIVRIAIQAEPPGSGPRRHLLLPGMPAKIDLRVGERSVLAFFTAGITRSFADSLHARGN